MWWSVCVDGEEVGEALGRQARLKNVRVRLQGGLAKLTKVQEKLCTFPSRLLSTSFSYFTLLRLSVA